MTITQDHADSAIQTPDAGQVDLKLEVVVIPVSDVERAKDFYGGLGWRLDADFVVGDAFRGVQFTPPGSPCSIHFGTGITSAAPGSASGMYLVVSDIEAACAELIGRGVEVSEVFHRAGPGEPPVSGRHPERRSYSSFATFQRSGRQCVAVARSHRATARAGGRPRNDIRFVHRARSRAPTSVGRSRRAREADRRRIRCQLAGLVRRVHDGGAGRQGAADMSSG